MTAARTVYAWQPQPGPQTALMRCPVPDVFYGGARGGGKTDAMLGEWLQHEAQYGVHARGIVFRRKRTQLADLKLRGIELLSRVGAKYNASEHYFTHRSGAVLRFAYLESDSDAENYQGMAFTRVYFEELCNFPDPAPIDKLKATLRSAHGVPCKMRSTGNPGGPGHTFVKARYIDPHPRGYTVIRDDESGMHRAFIPAKVSDNPALTDADPGYINRLKATGSPALVRAWLDGDWDAVQGAFLEGVWVPEKHIVEPFTIPLSWTRWRAMDWGFARPYAIGWYAMDHDGVVYLYRELYGTTGQPNVGSREDARVVARRVVDIEEAETDRGVKFDRSPADRAIWSKIGAEHSIAENFFNEGVYFVKSDSSPGSRVNGAQEVVARLNEGSFKVFSTCKHWLRTVPVIMADEKNPDDVDTEQEDHCFAAGTMVRTPQGCRPVESILPGDMVQSVDGWRLSTGATKRRYAPAMCRVEFDDGSSGCVTPEHQFWTCDGWTQACQLKNKLIPSWSVPPFKNSGVFATTIAVVTSSERAADCIGWCMRRAMAPLVKAWTSITAMKTALITGWRTWSVCHAPAIRGCTPSSAILQVSAGPRGPMTPPPNGTRARLALSGTRSTTENTCYRWPLSARWRNLVRYAASPTSRRGRPPLAPAFAAAPAELVRCVSVEEAPACDVYCIGVPVAHSFTLANGVLVANCWDMTRYSLMSRRRTPKAPPKPRRKDPHARTFDDVTGKARWGNDPVHDRFKRILDEGRE